MSEGGMTSMDAPSPPVRPKLNLAPRSAAASSGSAPAASGKPNPFGAARPREAVIAERTGVAETEVLKKDASQFASLRLRLTGEQSDQKRGKETELAEAKKALAEAKELGDDAITRIAASRCAEVEAELSALMANFEALAVQLAHEGGKRPSEQQRQGEGQPPRHGGGGGGGYEQRGGGGGYDGQRGGSNDDAFANFGGRNNRRGPPGGGGSEGGLDYGGAFGGRRGGGGGHRGDGQPPHEQGGYHGASGGHHYQDRD